MVDDTVPVDESTDLLYEIKNKFFKLLTVDLFTKGGGFLLMPIYLLLMTQEEFGMYSYFINIVMMLTMVVGVGQHTVFSRFYHSTEYEKDAVIETTYVLLAIVFVLVLIFFLMFTDSIASFLFVNEISSIISYGLFIMPCLFFLSLMQRIYFTNEEKIKILQTDSIVEFLLVNGLALTALYFISTGEDADIRVLAVMVAYLIKCIIFYPFTIRLDHLKMSNVSLSLFTRMMKNGLPMGIGAIFASLINFGDRFVIEKLMSKSELGIYSFALVISSIVIVFFTSFQTVWLPYFYKEKVFKVSMQRQIKVIKIVSVIVCIMAVVLYAVVYGLTGYIIESSYSQSLDFLWILILSTGFQVAGMLIAGYYNIFEKNHITVGINILFSLLNVALNYYFVGLFGLIGAAVSTLIVSIGLFVTHFSVVQYYGRKNPVWV